MRIFQTAVLLLSIATAPGLAATNDLERAVLSFPDVSATDYRPDVAAACANALISAGEDEASDALQEVLKLDRERSQQIHINRKVCHLCRLLFVSADSSRPLRPPALGAFHGLPANSMKQADWPELPFAISNRVPLSMNLGYMGSGVAEQGEAYLRYCKANGRFRTNQFPTPTYATASNALHQVFSSLAWESLKWNDSGTGWSYALDEAHAKALLWKQVENMMRAEKGTTRPLAR